METVIGHMDWQNGIAVPLGHALPSSDAQMANDTEVGNLPPNPGVQLAGAIPLPFPLPPPAVPGQPPEENQQFRQGPGTIPMEQAQEIEKWILEGIQGLKAKLPWNRAGGQESASQPTAGVLSKRRFRQRQTKKKEIN